MALVTGEELADNLDIEYVDPYDGVLDQVADAACILIGYLVTAAAFTDEAAPVKEAAMSVAVEMFQARTWLLFSAVSMVIVGMLVWGFFGSITQKVKGFGIIKTYELPREVLSNRSGQVDSVFCKTGDLVIRNHRLMKITAGRKN